MDYTQQHKSASKKIKEKELNVTLHFLLRYKLLCLKRTKEGQWI